MSASEKRVKLSRAEMTARFGAGIAASLPEGIWARGAASGTPVEAVAALSGFDSGDALRLALMQAKSVPAA